MPFCWFRSIFYTRSIFEVPKKQIKQRNIFLTFCSWSEAFKQIPIQQAKKVFSEVSWILFPLLRNLYKRSFGRPLQSTSRDRRRRRKRLSWRSPYSPKAGSDESCAKATLKVFSITRYGLNHFASTIKMASLIF